MSKQCNLCKKLLDESLFYNQSQRSSKSLKLWKYKDTMCKACRSEYTTTRRQKTKIQAVEYKGGKCLDCGVIDDPIVYDFHHIDPTKKDFAIGSQSKSFELIKQELDKCVLLCSNCHRKRHKTPPIET